MLTVENFSVMRGNPGARVRVKLKAWKRLPLNRGLDCLPHQTQHLPLSPFVYPSPWLHDNKTALAHCPQCGMDWSKPMGFYCPRCAPNAS